MRQGHAETGAGVIAIAHGHFERDRSALQPDKLIGDGKAKPGAAGPGAAAERLEQMRAGLGRHTRAIVAEADDDGTGTGVFKRPGLDGQAGLSAGGPGLSVLLKRFSSLRPAYCARDEKTKSHEEPSPKLRNPERAPATHCNQ